MLRHRFRRLSVWISGTLAVMLAVVISVYSLRDVLLGPHLKRLLQVSVENQLGIRLSIGNIHGSYLTNLEFTDISSETPPEGGAIALLKIRRLHVDYRLWSLWKGVNAFLEGAAVSVEGAELELSLSAQEEIPSAPQKDVRPKLLFLPEALPAMSVQGMSVVIRGRDYETRLSGVELDVRRAASETHAIGLEIAEWRWSHPGLRDGRAHVSAEITYAKGEVTSGRVEVDGKELVESIRIGLGDLRGVIPFEAKLRPAGGSLVLAGNLETSMLHVRIAAHEVDAARLLSLLGPDPPAIAGTFSMTGSFSLPWQRPAGLEASLDFHLLDGDLLGLKADQLELLAGAHDGMISLDRLRLRSGANFMDAHAVTFPAESAFSGDLRGLFRAAKGEFALDCRDLPAFVRVVGETLPSGGGNIPEHRIQLSGRVGGGAVEVSGGNLTVAGGGHIRVGPSRIAWSGEMGSIRDSAIQAAVDVDISDLGVISRIAEITPLKGSVRGSMKMEGTLGAPSGNVNFTAHDLRIADVWLGDIILRADANTRETAVRSVVWRRGDDQLSARGRFHFAEKRVEDARIEFHVADFHPYVDMLWPGYRRFFSGKARAGGGVSGNVTVTGPLRMPGGTANLEVRRIRVGESPWGDATLRLRSEGGTISVDEFSIRHERDRMALSGAFDLSARHARDVKLEIAIEELAHYTRSLLPETRSISAHVRGTLMASGTLAEPEGRMKISARRLRVLGVDVDSASIECSSSGRIITIGLAEVNAVKGSAALSGRLFRGPDDKGFDLDLSRLVFIGHETRLDLDGPARVSLLREGWSVSLRDVSLSGPSGRIRLDGRVAPEGDSDLHISLSDVNSGKWFGSLVTDRLSFQGLNAGARIFGNIGSPQMTLRGDLANIYAAGGAGALSGRFDLSYGNDGVTVREFEWRDEKNRRISVSGDLPLNFLRTPIFIPGRLAMEADLELPELNGWDAVFPGYIPAGGSFFGRLQLGGTWDAPSGTVVLRGDGLNRPPRLEFLPPGPFDVQGRVRIEGRDLAVESLEVRAPNLTLSGSGAWTGMPPVPDLFQKGVRKAAGRLAMAGRLHVADLGWLAAQSPHIRRISGQLDAKVSVEGSASDPAVSGTLRVTGGELRPDLDVPSVQALNLEAVATPDTVHVQTLSGELGAAPFHVTGSLGRSGQGGMEADLRLRGENLLLYRSEGVKLRADADLTLNGLLSRLHLAGEVAVTDGYYERYFDVLNVLKGFNTPKTHNGFQLFSFRTPPFGQATFDVGLTSRQPFKVRNNLFKGSLRPDLRLSGTGELPVLTGAVYIDETRLILPAGVVVFESGLLRFDKSRPDRPALHLIGKSRMGGHDITMLVEGPYDEPTVTLSSVPPVSSEDLLFLVLTGRIPDAKEGTRVSERQQLSVAVYVGRDLISRWFGGQSVDTDTSILERFEIDVGRGVTRTGDDTIDAQFRLAKGFLRVGDTLYITGEKDVFDFYNAGIKIVFRFK